MRNLFDTIYWSLLPTSPTVIIKKDPEVIVNGNTTILKFDKKEKYISKTCEEDTFDIEIDNEDAEKIATVGDAVEQIKNAIN